MSESYSLTDQKHKLDEIYQRAMEENNFTAARQALESQFKLMDMYAPAAKAAEARSIDIPPLSEEELRAYDALLEESC